MKNKKTIGEIREELVEYYVNNPQDDIEETIPNSSCETIRRIYIADLLDNWEDEDIASEYMMNIYRRSIDFETMKIELLEYYDDHLPDDIKRIDSKDAIDGVLDNYIRDLEDYEIIEEYCFNVLDD